MLCNEHGSPDRPLLTVLDDRFGLPLIFRIPPLGAMMSQEVFHGEGGEEARTTELYSGVQA
jgi:hypothetical protein